MKFEILSLTRKHPTKPTTQTYQSRQIGREIVCQEPQAKTGTIDRQTEVAKSTTNRHNFEDHFERKETVIW